MPSAFMLFSFSSLFAIIINPFFAHFHIVSKYFWGTLTSNILARLFGLINCKFLISKIFFLQNFALLGLESSYFLPTFIFLNIRCISQHFRFGWKIQLIGCCPFSETCHLSNYYIFLHLNQSWIELRNIVSFWQQ